MKRQRSFSLDDAFLFIMLLLLPVMLLVGAAETGPLARPGLLFWLLLLLPILFLPWLFWPAQKKEESAAAGITKRSSASTASPAMDAMPSMNMSKMKEPVPLARSDGQYVGRTKFSMVGL